MTLKQMKLCLVFATTLLVNVQKPKTKTEMRMRSNAQLRCDPLKEKLRGFTHQREQKEKVEDQ